MHLNYQTCAVKPQIELSLWDVLSSLPTALVILNAKGRIVWLNPAAEAMLGYGLLNSLWVKVIDKAFVPKADDGHEVSLADGRRVHVAVAAFDSLPGTLITLTDITTSRDYEKAKAQDKRLAAIGTMTAQLAHQIRTPLASAMLYSEHLNNQPNLDARSKIWMQRLQDCHASIEQQIQDLLLFARGVTIKPEWLDMSLWCEQLVQRAQPQVESHKATLTLHNQLRLKEAFIHGESLLGAVLNLVINALQSQAKELHITLATLEDAGLELTIEDNGCGMTKKVKSQAFSPFYTTKAQGNGLGLAVVFAVVKAHGGKVTLDSTEGLGTQVRLRLPAKA